MTLVHGSPRDPIWEYVDDGPGRPANLECAQDPVGLHGHTHVPSVFAEARTAPSRCPSRRRVHGARRARVLINPGSVGQPRDGDPRASAVVMDAELLTLTWHRVAYDIAATQAAMRRLKLPDRLVDRLDYGL